MRTTNEPIYHLTNTFLQYLLYYLNKNLYNKCKTISAYVPKIIICLHSGPIVGPPEYRKHAVAAGVLRCGPLAKLWQRVCVARQ